MLMQMVVIERDDLRVMIRDAVNEALISTPQQQLIPEPEPASELMTRKEVSKLFGVSMPTLISWAKENILPCLHFRRSVRYKRADVEKLLKSKNKIGGVR